MNLFRNRNRNRNSNSKKQFEELTYPLHNDLFRLALWRLGNRLDAEDVLQETYLRAFRSFHTFTPGSNLKGWMTKILLNVVNDLFKKRLRQPELLTWDEEKDHLDQIESLQSSSYSLQDPQIQLSEREIDPLLTHALRRLPSALLNPLLLRELEDMSYEDISKVLDVPIGTVMSRLFRARRTMKENLLQGKTSLVEEKKEVPDDAV